MCQLLGISLKKAAHIFCVFLETSLILFSRVQEWWLVYITKGNTIGMVEHWVGSHLDPRRHHGKKHHEPYVWKRNKLSCWNHGYLGFSVSRSWTYTNWKRIFSSPSFSSFFLIALHCSAKGPLAKRLQVWGPLLTIRITSTSMWTRHSTGLSVLWYFIPITLLSILPQPPMTLRSPKSVTQTSHCMTTASPSSWLLIQLFPQWPFIDLISISTILTPSLIFPQSVNSLFFHSHSAFITHS